MKGKLISARIGRRGTSSDCPVFLHFDPSFGLSLGISVVQGVARSLGCSLSDLFVVRDRETSFFDHVNVPRSGGWLFLPIASA